MITALSKGWLRSSKSIFWKLGILSGALLAAPQFAAAAGAVHSRVYVSTDGQKLAPGKPDSNWIYIPDFEVFLQDGTGNHIATSRSDMAGWLEFRNVQDGSYKLCWNMPSFVAACSPNPAKVESGLVVVPAIEVRVDAGSTSGAAIFGRVSLKDDSSAVFIDQTFAISQVPEISLQDAAGNVLAKTHPSSDGQYILATSTAGAAFVSAKLEALEAKQTIPQNAALGALVNLKFDAARPETDEASVASLNPPPANGAHQLALQLNPANSALAAGRTLAWATLDGKAIAATGDQLKLNVDPAFGGKDVKLLVKNRQGLYNSEIYSLEHSGATNTANWSALKALKKIKLCGPNPTPATSTIINSAGFLTYYDTSGTFAQGYYNAINAPPNFAAWLAQAGFNPKAPSGVGINNVTSVQTQYFNHNDLGFGRRMTMRKAANGNVYSFVTNFKALDPCKDGRDAADAAVANKVIGQTVAMSFEPLNTPAQAGDPPGKMTKFYVYDTSSANKLNLSNALLLPAVALDVNGPKQVPNLCITCHGGQTINNTGVITKEEASLRFDPAIPVSGSHFREFDLASFRYPTSVLTNTATHVPTSVAVLKKFRLLNTFTNLTNPSPAIAELIAGWKGTGSTFNANFTPPGWLVAGGAPAVAKGLYKDVVAKACRTCHVAIGGSSSIDWHVYSGFRGHRSTIFNIVCPSNLPTPMPQAQVTSHNFWTYKGSPATDPAFALSHFSAAGSGVDWAVFPTAPNNCF